ncbi:clasp N terminal-domain-containing protein [Triangularia verruculosa]|uniref:Clasp N terminal-domain-containing protein n=1 Tax=Triangularia verruculosa TaxID=2587418 RepID=A0AAN6XL05_9PEZI|nr:clasp N terminal-domain-containing protein [Triangularia verruculosa]
MADPISEQQVIDLTNILRTDAPVDTKIQHINAAKSCIKSHYIPEPCIAPLFDALRTASSSQHGVLVNAGFGTFNHLLTRLRKQDPKVLSKEVARTGTLPLLVEKLGDHKDKIRYIATQALVTLYKVAPEQVERAVRNLAMTGKNAKAKESSLHWLLQMHQESGLPFRSYVPSLMDLLEDADATVRETAKTTVIELFRNAPNTAKSDLKRQLKNCKVRPAIEQAIVKELIPASASASQADSIDEHHPRPASRPASRAALSASASSHAIDRPITPAPDSSKTSDPVEPSYVNTKGELDEILREMHANFEGRETEHNWMEREKSVIKLRKLIAGNAAQDFTERFIDGLRSLLDGIIKAVTSLRTSLCTHGCNLVQDMARAFGPGIDPMVEIIMQTFIKLAASTKKLASQQANVTVDAIISNVTTTPRIMQHVWFAVQDKNVQPRLYACGWLQTILVKEAHHKHHVEHTGGLDVIEKCIKKGLADANPGVREKARATFWKFNGIWPARAEVIMDGLDGQAQKLLKNDPNNPNPVKRQPAAGGARPGLGLSKSTMEAPKPSIRDAIMAKKKAMASGPTRNPPTRPGSAMAHFSPVRTDSGSSEAPAAAAGKTMPIRSRPESTLGGLSGAPMRPGRKRPEVVPRPATAGPYSVRSHDQPSNEQASPPENRRPKSVITPKSITSSPKRTLPKPARLNQPESNLPTPTRAGTPKFASPRSTPSRIGAPLFSSPRASAVDLSVPTISVAKHTSPNERHHERSPLESVETLPSLSDTPSRTREDLAISTYEDHEEIELPLPTSKPPSPAPQIVEAISTTTSPTTVKVYEDPFTAEQAPPKPTFEALVLDDKSVNEGAATLRPAPVIITSGENGNIGKGSVMSPEKLKQNSRLLESGITKVKAKSLDVHGFRKLQSIIRDSNNHKGLITDEKFDALLIGLFEYIESPLPSLAPEKVQDVKAQVLATIKVMLKKMRGSFQPHVSRGLESLLRARARYEGRTHMVSGLELLAGELVMLGDAGEIVMVLARMLQGLNVDDADRDSRVVSMGLHVLKEMMEQRGEKYVPTEPELEALAGLAAKCLESVESAVRMDAVLLCVALHARVGDGRFWGSVKGVREDPKSLITYYIVRRQREGSTTATAA